MKEDSSMELLKPDDPDVSIRPLTNGRMRTAVMVALAADALQLFSGPIGLLFFDEIVDVVAALIIWRLIGFHWMLLPTIGIEFLPFIDMLPTWTGCVLWVIRKRKQEQRQTTEVQGRVGQQGT